MARSIDEQLKDRRDYRNTLIHRREMLEHKIKGVESEIKELNDGKFPARKVKA